VNCSRANGFFPWPANISCQHFWDCRQGKSSFSSFKFPAVFRRFFPPFSSGFPPFLPPQIPAISFLNFYPTRLPSNYLKTLYLLGIVNSLLVSSSVIVVIQVQKQKYLSVTFFHRSTFLLIPNLTLLFRDGVQADLSCGGHI
jgi:hypothetical protein